MILIDDLDDLDDLNDLHDVNDLGGLDDVDDLDDLDDLDILDEGPSVNQFSLFLFTLIWKPRSGTPKATFTFISGIGFLAGKLHRRGAGPSAKLFSPF